MRAVLLLWHHGCLYVSTMLFICWDTNEIVVNFIQRPLPDGSTTGAGYDASVPGALGMRQRASTGLTLCELDWLTS